MFEYFRLHFVYIFIITFLRVNSFVKSSEPSTDDCSSGKREFFNNRNYFCDPEGTLLSQNDADKLEERLSSGHNMSCLSANCHCGFEMYLVALANNRDTWFPLDTLAHKFSTTLGLRNCFLVLLLNKTSLEVGIDHSEKAKEFLTACYDQLREPLKPDPPLIDVLLHKVDQLKSIMEECSTRTLAAEESLKKKAVIPIIIVLAVITTVVVLIAIFKCARARQFRPVNTMEVL